MTQVNVFWQHRIKSANKFCSKLFFKKSRLKKINYRLNRLFKYVLQTPEKRDVPKLQKNLAFRNLA